MAFRFRPVEGNFFEQFTALARHLTTGADLLAELLAESADRTALLEALVKTEDAAGDATRGLVKQVNLTFVTPFDREDIYRLAVALQVVMDRIEEAGGLIEIYRVKALPPEFSTQVETIQRCADLTAHAMARLRTLHGVDDYWVEINRLENRGDKTHRRVLSSLFDGSRKALEVIKLKDIASALEGAIDAFAEVANVVKQIAVKES